MINLFKRLGSVRFIIALLRYEEASSDILYRINIPKEPKSDEEFQIK